MITNGRIKVVLLFNVVAIAASVGSLFLNFWLIALSRLVHGFASGVLVTAAPKTLEESIPAHLLGYGFGSSTNILINAAIMCLMLIGIGMPDADELATSSMWRLFYAFPIPFSALAILMHLLRHRGESPHFYVTVGEKGKALEGLQQVYPAEPSETLVKLYEQQRAIFEEQASGPKPGMGASVADPEYRRATLVGCSVALFNTMSGINILTGFSKQIFEAIAERGAVSNLSPTEQNYFVGVSSFVGASLSVVSVAAFTRRTCFIGGHIIMGVMLAGVSFFIDQAEPNYALACMCLFIIALQMSNGTLIWIYCSEICTDAALGLCVFILMGMLVLQSLTSLSIMNSSIGVDGLFYGLGAFQAVAALSMFFTLKETKGISFEQKINLYKPNSLKTQVL